MTSRPIWTATLSLLLLAPALAMSGASEGLPTSVGAPVSDVPGSELLADGDWMLTQVEAVAVNMAVPTTFDIAVDEDSEVRLSIRTSSGEYGRLDVAGPGKCDDWTAYQGRIVQGGPVPANLSQKECGEVDAGDHPVTLTLFEGAGTLYVEVHQRTV